MKRIAAALLGGWLLAGVGTPARAEHPDLGWLTYTGAPEQRTKHAAHPRLPVVQRDHLERR